MLKDVGAFVMNNRLFKILVLSIIVILLVSLACVSLVACGDKKKAEEVKKNDKFKAGTKLRVVVTGKGMVEGTRTLDYYVLAK